MKTRKLRLLSFVLAVAMMFAIAPVSAFAEDDDTDDAMVRGLEQLELNGDGGLPSNFDESNFDSNPANPGDGAVTWTPKSTYGSGWTISRDNKGKIYLNILVGKTWDLTANNAPKTIRMYVSNRGTINCAKDTAFTGKVYNYSTIRGGNFTNSFDEKDAAMQSYSNSLLDDGVVSIFKFANNNATLKNSIVYNPMSTFSGNNTIENSMIPSQVEGSYLITAEDCTINGYFENTAYVVGDNFTVTVAAPRSKFNKFKDWEVNPTTLNTTKSETSEAYTISFTMPGNADVTITPLNGSTPLQVNDDGLPVDESGARFNGTEKYDGWNYSPTEEKLRIYAGTNASLKGAKIGYSVKNMGAVDGGTYTGTFENIGTVENATFGGYFYNSIDEELNEDGTETVTTGKVKSGVFTPKADFGNQTDDLNLTWLNVKNGTINNVDKFSMASVVGEQKVTVKPNFSKDLFRGWTYSGNISNAVAEQLEKQKNNYEMTLTLDGDAEDSINLMPMIDGEPFGITMLGGKATVDNADVSAAVPGQTVTLSIDDSEIPAGMSFDHWVVNPADVELEGGFDAASRTTSFTMPAEELTIYASLRTDSGDDGTDAMTVVAGVAVGAGAAALTYHIGTELYAEQVLGKGVAIPRTREEVALKAWELAGKPAVELNGEPLSEAAQAEKWAVESGLMQNVDGSFNGQKKMSKLKALRTLDAAKKLG